MDVHPQILGAAVSALAALVGGFLGVWFSHSLTKRIKLREWQFQVLKDQLSEKRKAYAEFIACAHTIMLEATINKAAKVTLLSTLNSSFATVELMAAENVSSAARVLVSAVISHFGDAKIKESTNMEFVNSKQAFLDAARSELVEHEQRAARELAR